MSACTHVRCAVCGYSPHDEGIHADHHLCRGRIPPPCVRCDDEREHPVLREAIAAEKARQALLAELGAKVLAIAKARSIAGIDPFDFSGPDCTEIEMVCKSLGLLADDDEGGKA